LKEVKNKYDNLLSRYKEENVENIDEIASERKNSPNKEKRDTDEKGKDICAIQEEEIKTLTENIKKLNMENSQITALLEKIYKESQTLQYRIQMYDETKTHKSNSKEISFDFDDNLFSNLNSEGIYDRVNTEIFKDFEQIFNSYEKVYKKYLELKITAEKSIEKYKITTLGDVGCENDPNYRELYLECYNLILNTLKNSDFSSEELEDKNLVELFNLIGQEISENNDLYEDKLKKSKEKVKKYKNLCKELKDKLEKKLEQGSIVSGK